MTQLQVFDDKEEEDLEGEEEEFVEDEVVLDPEGLLRDQ